MKRLSVVQGCLLLGLVIFLLVGKVPIVNAADVVLQVADVDKSLHIRGTLTGETTSFSGVVRLTAVGGDVSQLSLLASALTLEGEADYAIERSQVAIAAGTALSNGQPHDVRVTVSNVQRPGKYEGELRFLLPGQTEAEALLVPLILELTAVPAVEALPNELALQLVRCQNKISCRLAQWLLPTATVTSTHKILLDNQTKLPVPVETVDVVLRGERSGQLLPETAVRPELSPSLAIGLNELTVQLDQQALAADRYSGSLRLQMAHADKPLVVNTTLAVRHSPVWALVTLLLGIVLGRLVRNMETPLAQLQLKLRPRYEQLRAAVFGLKDKTAQAALLAALDQFLEQLDGGRQTEEQLVAQLAAIEEKLRFLSSLESLKTSLGEKGTSLKEDFAKAQAAILRGDLEEAKRQHEAIKQKVVKIKADGSMGEAEQLDIQAAEDGLETSLERLAQQIPVAVWWQRLLAGLSGIGWSSGTRYWVFRPFLGILLLILLLLLGMQTLYVNAGATFGAAGLYDYLGLLLWGLSADVASRSLSSLSAKSS